MKTDAFSPVTIEKRLQAFEEKAIQALSSTSAFFVVPASLLICGLLYYLFLSWQGLGRGWDRHVVDVYYLMRIPSFIIVLSSVILLISKLSRGSKSWTYVTLTVGAWMIADHFFWDDFRTEPLHTVAALGPPLLLLFGQLYILASSARPKFKFVLTCAYAGFGVFWMCATLWYGAGINAALARPYAALQMPSLIVATISFAYLGLSNEDDRLILTSPVALFAGVIWPPDSRLAEGENSERRLLWWRGFYDVVVGIFWLFVGINLDIWLEAKGAKPSLIFILPLYIATQSRVVGSLNIISGFAQLLGFRVRPATERLFFAKSPIDWWRRESAYPFLFNFRFVFFPAFRRTRNFGFAVVAAFTATYMIRMGLNDMLLAGVLYAQRSSQLPFAAHLLRRSVFAWFFEAFILLVSTRWWILRRGRIESPARQWLAVAVTHVLYACPLWLAYMWFE